MRISLIIKTWFIFILLFIGTPTVSIAKNHSVETTSLFDLPLSELMNVEITTAGKTREKVKDIPASVVIVTRKEIERYGYATLTDILENVPGMYNIYSYTGAPGNFGVRGFWNPVSQNGNIAILVNGIRQFDEDQRSHPIANTTVPIEAIDRIEIIRGPMAVMYGSNASFGVINILTNDIENNDTSLISATYGSRNTRKLAMRVSEKIGDLNFVINASRYDTDGLDNKFSDMISPANQAILPFVGVTDPNYSTKDLLEHSNEYLGISGSYQKLYFDFAYNNTDVDTYALFPSLVNGVEHHVRSNNLMLGYADEVNRWLTLDGKIILSEHDNSDNIDIIDPTLPGTASASYDSWEVELLSTIKPNDRWHIIAGLNQRTMTDYIQRFNIPAAGVINELFERSDRTTQSIFSQATYTPDNHWTLVAGLRWENNLEYDRFGTDNIGTPAETSFFETVPSDSNVLPRAAVVYHLNDNHTFKFLYGESSKLVNDDTNNPESTKTLELNHAYTQQRFSIITSVFRNELDDLFIEKIVPTGGGGIGFQQSRAGELSTNGIEVTLTGRMTDQLRGELSATYQVTDDDFFGDDAAYSPETLMHAKIAYNHETTTYSLLGRYVGSMEPSFGSIVPGFSADPNIRAGNKIDGYFVFDANLRQDHLFGNGYINLRISNLFDEEIRYPNNTELSSLLDKGTIGADRSIFGTLGWKF